MASSNDAPAAHAGYARYRQALLDMGVELYEMRSDPETAAELLGSSSGNGSKVILKGTVRVGIGIMAIPGGTGREVPAGLAVLSGAGVAAFMTNE